MYFSAFKATKKFYLTQQGGHENVDEYYNRFDNATDLVHLFNADVVDIDNLLTVERSQRCQYYQRYSSAKIYGCCISNECKQIKV